MRNPTTLLRTLSLLTTLAAAGACGNPGGAVADLGTGDLDTPRTDMSSTGDMKVGAPIGASCTTTASCRGGKTPVCFTTSLFNRGGALPVQAGYCSSSCTSDGDCGSGASCVNFGGNGRWCLASCAQPSECRAGYTCFTAFAGETFSCFPSGNLDCDPTAGDGSCNGTGGCVRLGLGSGLRGACLEQCVIGAGTCAVGECRFADNTVDRFTGSPTADKWKGGTCFNPPLVANPVGDPCHVDGKRSILACVDGAECDFQMPNVNPGGDDRCRQLCFLAGGGPALDGGVSMGTPAGPCPNGTTCTDVFNEGSESDPLRRVGLCK